jgi:esterase/lipase
MKNLKSDLIFLHGALGYSADLSPLMDIFKEKGFNTHSFTFSGHGQATNEPPEFRIDHFAKDLESFLKNNDFYNPIVFGYSMGGYVALYYQAHFDDSPLKGIFTYGTKFNWSQETVTKELPMLNPEHLMIKYPQFVETLKTKHGERWKQVLLSTAHLMQNLEKLDSLTKEDVADISIPVVLIRGDQDRMVTSEETNLTSAWIPRSQVKTVAHSKHELERSNLKEIAEVVFQYMD